MTAFYASDEDEPIRTISSHLDDSIGEMASILLDDTTMNELNGEPGKRLSMISSAKILPQFPRPSSGIDKALPQLPQLLFNGDSAWAYQSHPVMTSAGKSNGREFTGDGDEPDSYPPPLTRQPSHVRKTSAPPVPRKSSKRRSHLSKPKHSLEPNKDTPACQDQNLVQRYSNSRSQIITTISSQQNPNRPMTSEGATEINNKIASMLTASRDLKHPPSDERSLHAPLLTTKRRRVISNNVIAKMKRAINERLHDSGLRTRVVTIGDCHLLDNSMSQLPDYDEEHTTVSAMEIRMNEGMY
jgi:hypothetical protein